MRMCHFRAQNGPFVLDKIFLVQAIVIPFLYLLAIFIVQYSKKFLQRIQSYDDAPFLGPKWSICPPNKFFFENYYYHSHLPISPFHWAKFKKNSSSRSGVMRMCKSRVMRMCNFWAQNDPFPQMRIFSENLLMSLVSFIHAYLHAKNQSQILIY